MMVIPVLGLQRGETTRFDCSRYSQVLRDRNKGACDPSRVRKNILQLQQRMNPETRAIYFGTMIYSAEPLSKLC